MSSGEAASPVAAERVGTDDDLLHLEVTGDLDRHHPAAGGGLDDLVLELLLGLHHLGLHLLDLLEHLVHVRLGHLVLSRVGVLHVLGVECRS